MIIDAWAQHPTLRHSQQPMFASLRSWMGTEEPTEETSIDVTLKAMDEAGVDKAILCAWQAPGYDLITNDEVAAQMAAAPDRFVALGSVDISKPLDAVREIRRCVEHLGFKGIRVLPWLCDLPPTHALYYPVYATCADLGVPFCLQIGHTGPLMPSEHGRPMYLDRIALDFPELTIVGGHIGYPWTDEAISVATKHKNVYLDTSAYTARRYPPQLVDYMKAHGRKKVLFGSNYPMITPKNCLEDLDELGLDNDAKQLFLSGNAKRIFGI